MNQLTIEQAHKELNSLADKIAAKYEQLDCGKFGTVGTPGFNAKPAELACLFVYMSQLFHRLNRLLFFKNWRTVSDLNLYEGRQSYCFRDAGSFVSHRSVRITGLLSTFSF